MPFRQVDPAAIERRLADIAQEERRQKRSLLRTLALLVLWPALGVVGMGWGFQMNDPVWGPTIFFSSAAVGNLGILATLVAAYRRGG